MIIVNSNKGVISKGKYKLKAQKIKDTLGEEELVFQLGDKHTYLKIPPKGESLFTLVNKVIGEFNWYYDENEIKKQIKAEPRIGMTKDEVLASTWGKPNDINKSTYEWGTTEQWCYSNYMYIYFDNGIVTSISE